MLIPVFQKVTTFARLTLSTRSKRFQIKCILFFASCNFALSNKATFLRLNYFKAFKLTILNENDMSEIFV